MIKIYTLKRLRACKLNVTDGSVTIAVNFEPSYGTQRGANGKVVIADPNVQSVLEADPKFNKVYELTDCHEDSVEVIPSINGSLQIAEPHTGRVRRTQAQIDADNAALAASEQKKPRVTEKAAKASRDSKKQEKVMAALNPVFVNDINEAVTYLVEKGLTWESEEQLEELMKQHNVRISED